jgi:hypothetical protein
MLNNKGRVQKKNYKKRKYPFFQKGRKIGGNMLVRLLLER